MFDLYVFTFHNNGQLHRALAVLSPEQVGEHGLPTEAVLGQIKSLMPSMTPDQFESNEAFLRLLHQVVQEHAPQLPALQSLAKTQGTGEVAVIDERTPITEVENEDILGWFEVGRGEIKPHSYRPNEHYRLLTNRGPLQLPSLLQETLLKHVHHLLAEGRS